MAISRSQMQRQLQNRGGITNLSPRQNFGLGSSLKKFARKIIPNEVSKVATAAAPFVAPFNPALAGAMAGIGSFDQTGSLSDAFKSGALTYGGGQAARYIGGAGFQGNPFASGGAFTPAGFTAGFSSPVGTDTGLGKLFSKPNAPISEVQPLGYEGSEVALTSGSPVDLGADTFTENMVFKDSIVPTNLNDYQGTKQVVDSVKENVFQRIMKDPSVSNIGSEALNAAKKVGKAIFFDKDGDLDKNVLLGTIAFTASYAEGKALADDVGVDLTESEYDEARKAEKQEQYAEDLQNFFAGKKDGGRIGFNVGGDFGIMKVADKEPEKKFDAEFYKNNIRNTIKSYSEPGMTKRLGPFTFGYMLDSLDRFLDEGGDEKIAGELQTEIQNFINFHSDTFQGLPEDERKKFEEKIKTDFIEEINIIHGLPYVPSTEAKDGGRIGFQDGTLNIEALMENIKKYPEKVNEITDFEVGIFEPSEPTDQGPFPMDDETQEEKEAEMLKELLRELEADGGRIGLREGTGGKKKYGTGILSGVKQIDPLQQGLGELKAGGGGIPMLTFSRLEKSFLFKNLAKLGGADRSFTMPQLYKILSNPSKFPKDAAALKAFLKVKGYQKGGDVGTAPEVPVRTNAAGVKELDYRQSGGFVPVGVKEKADDVPAMLSKNEFVLTADAVRGIGGGSVEKGSEKLYNVMKQAEQVGKA